MNESILEMWLQMGKVSIPPQLMPSVSKFIKYMDKHSLWLVEHEEDTFLFSNDAQRIRFRFSEMEFHMKNLELGISFPWNQFSDSEKM